MVQKLLIWNGTESELFDNPDVLATVLPQLRDDLEMVERLRQRASPKLDQPVFALAGSDDIDAPAPGLANWAKVTSGPFTLTETVAAILKVLGI